MQPTPYRGRLISNVSQTSTAMVMHPKNRPHSVDNEIGDFLHLVYKVFFDAQLDRRVQQRTFETAADSKNS
jgi:hypothetical protein